jgi:hypothetical protein
VRSLNILQNMLRMLNGNLGYLKLRPVMTPFGGSLVTNEGQHGLDLRSTE